MKGWGLDLPFPLGVWSFVFVCFPPWIHHPPPAYSGGPSHRAGRSVFSAMKLGKNRPHKEEPQRQGMNVRPCSRSSATPRVLLDYLSTPDRDQTPPLRRQRPNRLSCDWLTEPPWRSPASHWLAVEPGPDRGPWGGSAGRTEGGTCLELGLQLSGPVCL